MNLGTSSVSEGVECVGAPVPGVSPMKIVDRFRVFTHIRGSKCETYSNIKGEN